MGFGPLESLLRTISDIDADREVSPRLSARNLALTDRTVTARNHQEHGREAPLTRNLTG
jgi:hypothetical protein